MFDFLKKFDVSKISLFKGCFRLSIIVSFFAFFWGAIIEGPKNTSIAFGISSRDARDLRNAANIIIDGHEYTYMEGKEYKNGTKIENKYQIKQLDDWISEEEKNEIINKYCQYWNKYGRYGNIECSASYSCEPVIDRALKRIIKNNTYIDYSSGYLVSNKKYGLTSSSAAFANDGEDYVFAKYSPEGYSIVPCLNEKILWCSKIGSIWLFSAFLCISMFLPISLYVLYFAVRIPVELIKILCNYFHWVKNGFIFGK